MRMRRWYGAALLCTGTLALTVAPGLRAQEASAVLHEHATMKFTTFPNVPDCVVGAVDSGDPANSASTILMRLKSGCRVPWHWHTGAETILMVSGSVRAEMKGDQKPAWLRAGDYMMMPAHMIHQAQCGSAGGCTLFLHSSAAFDIHYVDASGNEIAAAEALAHRARMVRKKAPVKKE